MPKQSNAPREWIDGFLFVGNHLALDFLNTRPVLAEGPTELLPDVDALVRWVVTLGLVTRENAKDLAAKGAGQHTRSVKYANARQGPV